MVFNSIKVFARVKKEKPTSDKLYEISNGNLDEISFLTSEHNQCSNTPRFRFHKVFDQDVNQNDIFLTVAKPVINSVLQGFNGTIFAYGQTGSGKTYSITGSPKTYQDRGIIPRSIQDIFLNIEKEDNKPIIYISYMEIYNEICYDILHTKQSKTAVCLEELPRVVVLEDKNGEPRLRNLSIIPVSTEQEAMRLLFLGDTNRTIAETPMNEYSSRSHCIFTVYLTYREKGYKTKFSKLNLVDLAGSERVYKNQITGTILNEAKHINLSLHFLQQVILALSESQRVHIPYRNSVMTFILKDSLAGNCITVMLATLAVNHTNLQETISTCKFAQRVSLIKTEPIINEMNDPQREIEILKNEIQELRKQLAATRIKDFIPSGAEELSDFTKSKCEKEVDIFLSDSNERLNIETNMKQIQYCFALLKRKLLSKEMMAAKLNKKTRACDECIVIDENNLYLNQFDESLKQKAIIEESSYYTNTLNGAYEKAKVLANSIDECQHNILYLKKKLDRVHKKDFYQRILLSKELDYQQNIYKKSIIELREIQTETLHLESKLQKCNLLAKHHVFTKEQVHERGIKTCPGGCIKSKRSLEGENQLKRDLMNRYDAVCSCSELGSVYGKQCVSETGIYRTPFCNCEDCVLTAKKHNFHKQDEICSCENPIPNLYNIEKYSACQTAHLCNCRDFMSASLHHNQKRSNFELQQIPNKLNKDECFSVSPSVQQHEVMYVECGNTAHPNKTCIILENQFDRTALSGCDDDYINFRAVTTPYQKLEKYLNKETVNTDNSDQLQTSKMYNNVEQATKTEQASISHSKTLCFGDTQKNRNARSDLACSLNTTEYNLSSNEVVSELVENNHTDEDHGNMDSFTNLLRATDTNEFKEFIKTIPLTGDIHIDQEICEFYRYKFG